MTNYFQNLFTPRQNVAPSAAIRNYFGPNPNIVDQPTWAPRKKVNLENIDPHMIHYYDFTYPSRNSVRFDNVRASKSSSTLI
jgi:hypothetical protein